MVDWNREAFRRAYVDAGGTSASARSYVTYLNRVDSVLGGLSPALAHHGPDDLARRIEELPERTWGSAKNRRDSLSALRRYIELLPSMDELVTQKTEEENWRRVPPEQLRVLLAEAKSLAARYYALTGKPLGMTGEIAEMEAAERLGLKLCPPRTAWYDAIEEATGRRIQIKGKAVDPEKPYRGMCSAMRCSDTFDDVVLVLLDRTTSEPLEIWRAPQDVVAARIAGLTSGRRKASGVLAVTQFKSTALKIWSVSRQRPI